MSEYMEHVAITSPEIIETTPVKLLNGNPVAMIRQYREIADVLTQFIKEKKLYKTIGDRSHIYFEAWTFLGSMLGVFPVTVWTRSLKNEMGEHNGWEARVEARTLSGQVVGAAEGQCTRDEKMWGWKPKSKWGKDLEPRDDYALRSMAGTRAASKALKLPLGFIVVLAGFDPTPADEMPDEQAGGTLPSRPAPTGEPPADLSPDLERSIADAQDTRLQEAQEHVKQAAKNRAESMAKGSPKNFDKVHAAALGLGEFEPPPVCTMVGCSSKIAKYTHEAEGEFKGRLYWRCRAAYAEKAKMVKDEKTPAEISAALAPHTYLWAEPWPRVEAGAVATAEDGRVETTPEPAAPQAMEPRKAEEEGAAVQSMDGKPVAQSEELPF